MVFGRGDRSALSKNRFNTEMIVVGDGSTDNSEDVIVYDNYIIFPLLLLC
ncbi:hypothetical protein H6F93_24345 [Leptolyngbya sp. FACHB-671]|nr:MULTISPECIES: hypothetical protein [unclassified Leptolyngbya]MBD2001461.1 hypothetical protein [Leptolyngbya sp. FACHB-541]MBD2070606.1 hypothetical protein [Leptolyngbya sp. FACHB-671]